MNSNLKMFSLVILAVVLVAGGLIFLGGKIQNKIAADSASENGLVAGVSTEDGKDSAYIEKLAKFTAEKGMVLYGAYWCPHCKDQKKMFGDAFQYVDYVECDPKGANANPDECTAAGIEGYPTWIYQGQQYSGAQSLSQIAKIVGFSE